MTPREDRRAAELTRLHSDLSAIDLSEVSEDVRCISTGVLAFDLAMGGGFPESRFSEIFGEWQSGKSLICYQAIAQVQKAGGLALLFDSERAFDLRWARGLGINAKELLYYTPTCLEEAFATMETAVRTVRAKADLFKDAPMLIVFDSLAASVAEAEIDQPFGKSEMGLRARTISQALRKMTNLIADARVAVVFVNQLRVNIGVMYGVKEESTGGKAPKFYAGMRVSMKKGKRIADKSEKVIGVSGVLEVVKSKIGCPFKKVEFELYFDKGIDSHSGLLDYLYGEGVFTRSGSWYAFGEEKFQASGFPAVWTAKSEEIRKAMSDFRRNLAGAPVDVTIVPDETDTVEDKFKIKKKKRSGSEENSQQSAVPESSGRKEG